MGSVDGGVGHAGPAVACDDVVVVDYSCSVDGLSCGDVGSVAVGSVAVGLSSSEVACLVHFGCSCNGGCCAGSCSCLEVSVGNFDYVAAVVVVGSCSLGDCDKLRNKNEIG